MMAARRSPVSRASLQRLAADVGARCSASTYASEAEEMEQFVCEVVRHAVRAGACTGRRSVGRAQVQYGLRAAGAPAPIEVARLSDSELRRLRRCNVRAPAQTRKPSALSVEIPEASFARLLYRAAAEVMGCCSIAGEEDNGETKEKHPTVRFSAAARRVLHVTAEVRTAQRLKAASNVDVNNISNKEETCQTLPPLPGVVRVLEAHGAAPAAALELAAVFEQVCSSLESLLDIGSCVTVSPAHVGAALQSVQLLAVAEEAPQAAVATLERALRGRLPDRRFHKNAPKLLASSLLAAALNLTAQNTTMVS